MLHQLALLHGITNQIIPTPPAGAAGGAGQGRGAGARPRPRQDRPYLRGGQDPAEVGRQDPLRAAGMASGHAGGWNDGGVVRAVIESGKGSAGWSGTLAWGGTQLSSDVSIWLWPPSDSSPHPYPHSRTLLRRLWSRATPRSTRRSKRRGSSRRRAAPAAAAATRAAERPRICCGPALPLWGMLSPV